MLGWYNFLQKHDLVAKNMIIGKYDGRGIKESVYEKYFDKPFVVIPSWAFCKPE